MKAFFAIAWYAFRAQTRNAATFSFGFIFPLVFISIFGLIGGTEQTIKAGLPAKTNENNPVVNVLKNQKNILLVRGSLTDLKTQLAQGKIAGIITIAEKDKNKIDIHVIRSTGFPQEAATITGIVSGIVDKTNLKLTGVHNPPVAFSSEELSGRKPRYIDFALPGQIGFAMLSTAIFGTVFGLVYLKKAGILKRMFATPTKPLTILLGQGTSRLIIALAQTVLILGVGVLAFKFYLPHGWQTFIDILIISVIGLIAFLGFGYFIAGFANDENSASPLTNLVTLPQFLLSGTFFASENLPTWIQPLANNLPLSYFNQALRKVTTEGAHLSETWPYLVGLIIWGTVMYILAARTFKWE